MQNARSTYGVDDFFEVQSLLIAALLRTADRCTGLRLDPAFRDKLALVARVDSGTSFTRLAAIGDI